MNTQTMRTWAEVDLRNIRHNVNNMRAQLPEGCRYLGVVKANAYGHGALPVAKVLQEMDCDYLAVACFDEALELREAGITLPILILGHSPAVLAPELAKYQITQAVSDLETAEEMSRLLSESDQTLKIHIKLETGMGRTGFTASAESARKDILSVLALPNLSAEGIFTHFAVSDVNGDPYTAQQFSRFISCIEAVEAQSGRRFEIRHCTNSGAMVNYPQYWLDMVRPGILLYGCYPAEEHGPLDLRPVMSLKSRVAMVTEHKAGDTISYGRTFTASGDMRIAVLPIGYADGLHRVLSNQLEVLLHGKRVRQIGRICMDMCMVDVTDLPEVREGDIATIFGTDGDETILVEELAEKVGTISYELLCNVAPRVPRVYLDD